MGFLKVLGVAALVASTGVLGLPTGGAVQKRAISDELYDDLLHYWKYVTAGSNCPSPNGQVSVLDIDQTSSDTQAYVARDDDRKEIVTVYAGTMSTQDVGTDLNFIPVPYISSGVSAPIGSLTHAGFLIAYNSIADEILSTVKAQLALYPDYELVSLGHSLGGAIASLSGVSLAQNFPDSSHRLYTYGQPRTFNKIGANFVDKLFGENTFRVTHTADPVPLIVPRLLGYRHHGTEYWQGADPSAPDTFVKCAGQEDSRCNLSTVGRINATAHGVYMGLPSSTDTCQ